MRPEPVAAAQWLRDADALLAAEDWPGVERTLAELPALVARVPRARRGELLVAARTTVAAVRQQAIAQQRKTAERLSAIKAGRAAAQSYAAASAEGAR